MKLKLKYLATVSPFVLIFVVMALWMFSDLIGVEKNGQTYIYRLNHNFALLFLPLSGFMIALLLIFFPDHFRH